MVIEILPNDCHSNNTIGTTGPKFDQETANFLANGEIATASGGINEGCDKENVVPSTCTTSWKYPDVNGNADIKDTTSDVNGICDDDGKGRVYDKLGFGRHAFAFNNNGYVDAKVVNENNFGDESIVVGVKNNVGLVLKDIVDDILAVNDKIIDSVCHHKHAEVLRNNENNSELCKGNNLNDQEEEENEDGPLRINDGGESTDDQNGHVDPDGSIIDFCEQEFYNGKYADEGSGDEFDLDSSCLGDDDDNVDESDDDDDDLDVHSFLARMDEDNLEADTNSLEGETNDLTNPAIDKGYAWIVVIAVFFTHFLLVGYLKSGGVFFVEFQRQFHSNASMTSLVIGLSEAVYSITAFVVLGFLVKMMSVRQLCLIGSFFFVVGVVGNAACDHILFLLLTHSLGFGLANGLMYGPSVVIINEYFVKRRALANSIATTGASFGGIVFPLLARLLFDHYSFKGGIIMTGGVIMHAFIASILLVPVKYHARKQPTIPEITKDQNTNDMKSDVNSTFLKTLKQRWYSGRDDTSNKSQTDISGHINNSSIYQKYQPYSVQNTQHSTKFLGSGMKSLPLEQFSSKLEICEEGVPLEIQSEYPIEKNLQEAVVDFLQHNLISPDNVSVASQYSHVNESICSSNHQGGSRSRLDIYNSNPNVLEVPTNHTSNLLVMAKSSASKQTLSKSILFQSSSTLNNTIADIISIDQDCKRTTNDQSSDKRNVSGFRKLFSLCESPLLRSVTFWMFIPYFFSGIIGVSLQQIFLVPLAKERGLSDDQASFCISLLNIMDIVSHLVPGLIVNCGLMSSRAVCILPMSIVALVGQLTPFFHSYETFMGVSVVYGLCMGFFFAMQSLIIIDILGIKNFNSCIGIYYLTMGFAGAVSFPIAGALKDLTGTYSTTFHFLASMQVISVVILILLPLAKRYDVRRGILK